VLEAADRYQALGGTLLESRLPWGAGLEQLRESHRRAQPEESLALSPEVFRARNQALEAQLVSQQLIGANVLPLVCYR
jgi:hypothetical protein